MSMGSEWSGWGLGVGGTERLWGDFLFLFGRYRRLSKVLSGLLIKHQDPKDDAY